LNLAGTPAANVPGVGWVGRFIERSGHESVLADPIPTAKPGTAESCSGSRFLLASQMRDTLDASASLQQHCVPIGGEKHCVLVNKVVRYPPSMRFLVDGSNSAFIFPIRLGFWRALRSVKSLPLAKPAARSFTVSEGPSFARRYIARSKPAGNAGVGGVLSLSEIAGTACGPAEELCSSLVRNWHKVWALPEGKQAGKIM